MGREKGDIAVGEKGPTAVTDLSCWRERQSWEQEEGWLLTERDNAAHP